MNNKKKHNKGLITLAILFFFYLIVLYTKSKGYYEYKEYNKMIITKEAMERFENDIKNGNNLSINNYIDYSEKDYSSSFTKLAAKVGEESKYIVTKGISKLMKFLGKLFT